MCATKRLSEAQRKREIMNAAAKVIIDKGFEKTTMEEIIAGTTLSKGGGLSLLWKCYRDF